GRLAEIPGGAQGGNPHQVGRGVDRAEGRCRPGHALRLRLRVMEGGGPTWTGHNGGTPGANAGVHATTDGAWSAAVLANRGPPLPSEISRYIRGVVRAGGCWPPQFRPG